MRKQNMILAPFVVIKEAHSWISFQCKLRGFADCLERQLLSEILENDKGSANVLVTIDKIERVRDFIRTETYGSFHGEPSILKKLNAILLQYEQDQDLFKSGFVNMIKYYFKWGFR